VMVSPLNNVFTFRNAHTCLQCVAYQAQGSSNFPWHMTQAFSMHKPTAKESLECVIRETPSINSRCNVPLYFLCLANAECLISSWSVTLESMLMITVGNLISYILS
jgi:hypothetical protein